MESSLPVMNIDEYIDPEILDNQEGTEEHILTPVTRAKNKPLTAYTFEYIDDLPEYPASDIDGYAYVVSIGSRSQAEMEAMIQDVQYAKFQKYGSKRSIFSPFLNCQVRNLPMKCSGIRCCEFLAPQLKKLHHSTVNQSIWDDIKRYQRNIQLLEDDIGKRNAYSYYRSKITFFKKGHACKDQLPYCKPIIKYYNQMNVNGTYTPYIGCVNDTGTNPTTHHRMAIQSYANLDLSFLEDLFNKNILLPSKECGVFEPMVSRRKFCDRDHPQGNGRLIHLKCDVTFNALVPIDIGQCPYVLFISHGIHKHPPPPPTKPPERILQQIKEIIGERNDPSTTTAKFLRSPQLERFCLQHNTSTLTEVHASFCKKDRISAVIEKQQLLSYPNGQDISELIFLQDIDTNLKEYIQEYYHDTNYTMIFCGYKSQIELLARLPSFEVEVSYKRIRNKDINEVVFATFLPDQAEILTLLRVFTNINDGDGYYHLFQYTFMLLKKVTGFPVLFHHLHGSGIYGIIVDMDPAQYSGLGRYLAEIDPQKHDSTWQLQHIIMFGRAHFQRNVLKAIQTKNRGSPLWSRMMNLLSCETEADYDELIELFIRYEAPAVQNWAIQKKGIVIKAGLNKACSKMNPFFFDKLQNHTNAVEQSCQKANALGKYLTLAEAVKNSAKLDNHDIQQYQSSLDSNIHHSYQTSNMEANYLRHMSRERSRKRQRSASSSEPQIQRPSRSRSQSSRNSENNSTQYLHGLRRVTSTNALSLEQERQRLELRRLEVEIKEKEEIIRERQLQNERTELDLMERRLRIQESQASDC